ncbi:Plasmodium exported protein, unknown function [Plasmodium ovale]|uniref:Uncharacterized protein n=2 Tax=Plasmodium ovale TaxID=36330 RepID=A0A1A8WAU5_PLAOA|nr:Plasmodium exported protein, unknown function [Plasmodium ovale curtisi]SBS99943.1 Plasmodium exported protein, unknown function [Plasmodium ovale curtisi]SBT84578.1 Plasmodium exported protein, unknown function [Plasmodium ovale]
MKISIELNRNAKSRNSVTQVRNWLSFASPLTALKLNCKNIRVNMLNFLLSIIALVLLFWQSRAPYDMNNGVKELYGKGNMCEDKKGRRYGRILRSDHINIFQQFANTRTRESNYRMPLTHVIELQPQLSTEIVQEDDEDYEYELEELIDKITDTWNDTFRDMIEDYIDFTEQNNILDNDWKCQMWNQRWYRYLQHLVSSLNAVIQDDSYSLDAKEYVSNEFLYWANHDFIWFLSIVKDEWDTRTENEIVEVQA